ncbi:MAG: hypothetical protein R3A13_06350 [Bdellovibrionota bacterium]
MLNCFTNKLNTHIPPYTLASFRIVFGALMLGVQNYWDKIYLFWTIPKFNFAFEFFSFLPVLRESGMYLAHILMGIGAALIVWDYF